MTSLSMVSQLLFSFFSCATVKLCLYAPPGCDSLLAIRIRAAIVSFLKQSGSPSAVPRNVIYRYPTTEALVAFVLEHILPTSSEGQNGHANGFKIDAAHRITRLIDKHSMEFSTRCVEIQNNEDPDVEVEEMVFALTGTTGTVGSYFTHPGRTL